MVNPILVGEFLGMKIIANPVVPEGCVVMVAEEDECWIINLDEGDESDAD